MLDPKMIAEFDQSLEGFIETFPRLLWNFYKATLSQGFSEQQAMELTKAWLVGLRQTNS